MPATDQRRGVPGRRSLGVIGKGTALAAVLAFAVVVAAMVIGYGVRADRSAGSAGSVDRGGAPLGQSEPALPAGGGPSSPSMTSSSGSAGPGSTPTPIPSLAGPRASSRPGPSQAGRPASGPPSHGPTPTTPTFAPIIVQAEAVGNVRTGAARTFACATCAGGARVGYIGGANQLFIDVSLSVAGRRILTITYESDGPRTLTVSADGAVIAQQRLTGVGWETPMTYDVPVTLPAGLVRLGFSNDGPAPDVDLIVIR